MCFEYTVLRMKDEEIRKKIEEVFYNGEKEPESKIHITTGRGGAIEVAKSFLESLGKENPTDQQIEATLEFYIAIGEAKVSRWEEDGKEYESWTF